MRPFRFICSFAAVALLAACTMAEPAIVEAPPPTQILLDSGDQLQITVLEQADLTGAYTIDETGVIAMPLIGSVAARGRTSQGLASAIEAALRQGFLRNPDVTVQVSQYRPVFVLGEVGNPGQYAYLAGLTAQQAVALAGGFTARANQNVVDAVRRYGTDSYELRLELSDQVLPGDTLTVRQRLF